MRNRILAGALIACLAVTSMAMAGGRNKGRIYVHDETYKTFGTPTDLPEHGKFDHIYVLGDPLLNVADAAPGDQDFNGGRWEVRPVTWETISPMQFTNVEDLFAARDRGEVSIGPVVKRFECPVIPDNGR